MYIYAYIYKCVWKQVQLPCAVAPNYDVRFERPIILYVADPVSRYLWQILYYLWQIPYPVSRLLFAVYL